MNEYFIQNKISTMRGDIDAIEPNTLFFTPRYFSF